MHKPRPVAFLPSKLLHRGFYLLVLLLLTFLVSCKTCNCPAYTIQKADIPPGEAYAG